MSSTGMLPVSNLSWFAKLRFCCTQHSICFSAVPVDAMRQPDRQKETRKQCEICSTRTVFPLKMFLCLFLAFTVFVKTNSKQSDKKCRKVDVVSGRFTVFCWPYLRNAVHRPTSAQKTRILDPSFLQVGSRFCRNTKPCHQLCIYFALVSKNHLRAPLVEGRTFVLKNIKTLLALKKHLQ